MSDAPLKVFLPRYPVANAQSDVSSQIPSPSRIIPDASSRTAKTEVGFARKV